jgi:multiple sugar transport system substrate-binding protein
MANGLRFGALAFAAILVAAGCSASSTPSPAPPTAAPPTAAPPTAAATAAPTPAAATPTAAAATPTAAAASQPAASVAASAPASAAASATPYPSLPLASTPPYGGTDDGTQLTLWTRAATEARAQPLVDRYNASHKNHVNLTIVPTDDYVAKVAAAAGSGGLPDLVSGDVVFMPNWTSAGLFQDITDKVNALPFKSAIAPGAVTASTWQNKIYGLPFVVDLSVWMYNKKLFQQAGLDPNKPPTSLTDFVADAEAVGKLGNGIHGTFFGGDCGGCNVFTWWPIAWADGQTVMNADGTQSNLNSAENKAIYADFRKMVEDGTMWMPDSQTETGPTWTSYLLTGKLGIMPWPATLTGLTSDNVSSDDIGATPISGINGGQATFIGGDAVGISRDSKNADQAWNFLEWLEDSDAQINVVAAGGNVLSRTDLSNNPYTSKDPRTVMFNTVSAKGQTPFAINFNQTFNDPQGPWLVLLRDAVFGDASKIDADNDLINQSLQQK